MRGHSMCHGGRCFLSCRFGGKRPLRVKSFSNFGHLNRANVVSGIESLCFHLRIGHPQPDHIGSHSRSEEHTSELQSRLHLVCRLLLEKKKKILTMFMSME